LRGTALTSGLIAALALAVFAPSAVAGTAVIRYAEPGGDGPSPCLDTNPCDIQVAVESAPLNSQVFLLPGEYDIGSATLTLDNDVDVSGLDFPDDIPVIRSTAAIAVETDLGSFLEGVSVVQENTGGTDAVLLHGGLLQQAYVTSDGDRACNVDGSPATVRDTYCLNTKANGVAAAVASTGDATGIFTNVTAVSSGVNSFAVWASAAPGTEVTFDGANVIALSQGEAGTGKDQGAITTGDGTANVDLISSNFDSAQGFPSMGGTTNLTLPGEEASNQDDAGTADDPDLAGATTGDPHELDGSPTIDAGTDLASNFSTADIDDDLRILGDAPDIGADEFVPVPEPPDGAPDTEITKGPKKKTTKRKAKFKFESSEAGSTFECKLDKKPFKPCESPFKKKVKAGKKHKFKVRAIDADGNADPTPAKAKWKVLERD
jgi:hypothetical protein